MIAAQFSWFSFTSVRLLCVGIVAIVRFIEMTMLIVSYEGFWIIRR